MRQPGKIWVPFLIICAGMGSFTGLGASWLEMAVGPIRLNGFSNLYYAIQLYGLIGCLLGLLLGFIYLIGTFPKRNLFHTHSLSLIPGLIFPAVFFTYLILGYYINNKWLPWEIDDKRSLIFNGVFTLFFMAITGISVWILIRHQKKSPRKDLSAGFKRFIQVWFVVYLLAILLPFSFLFLGGKESEGDSLDSVLASLQPIEGDSPFQEKTPSIFLILVDTMRADHLSCYGYDRNTSPAMDRLAGDGTLFINGYSSSRWTIPSVATLFSGLYPSAHKTQSAERVFPSEVLTLAECLSALDYQTGSFMANRLPDPIYGYGQGFDYLYPAVDPNWFHKKKTAIENIYLRFSSDMDYYRGVRIIERTKQWLSIRTNDRFFAYMHFMEPHAPYTPPGKFKKMFDPDYKEKPVTIYPAKEDGQWVSTSDRKLQNMIAQYDGEIAYIDSQLGKFFDYLKAEGLYDRSIIILVADHGEEFFEHEGWSHTSKLYRQLTHIPFIVKWPEGRFKGTQSNAHVELIDIKSTLLDVLGYRSSVLNQGQSFLSDLEDPSQDFSTRAAYGEDASGWFSIRNSKWTYIEHNHSGDIVGELFSATDTIELESAHEKYPEVTTDLAKQVNDWHQKVLKEGLEAEQMTLDDDRLDMLKDLGYLGN